MAYFDYAANAPVDKEILELYMETALRYYANPNSNHKLGKEANAKIVEETARICELLKLEDYEIIYTSGATEANNLAIKGIAERYKSRGKHILMGGMEHNSIVSSCAYLGENGYEVEVLNVDRDGLVSLDELKSKLRDDTILVSIAVADGELGIRQDVESIGELLKEYPNVHFHVDASQAIGKCAIDFQNIDAFTLTPHKIYGMNSFGALCKKKELGLKLQMHGGKSTTVFRSGTPDVAMITAMRAAIERAVNGLDEHYVYVSKIKKELVEFLEKYKDVVVNDRKTSLPYLLNFSYLGSKSNDLVAMLEEKEIYVSAKTSCCPIETPSKHVYALTHDKKLAGSAIRVSLSHHTTKEEVEEFKSAFSRCMKELGNE